jgi:hypothetical protein
MLRKTGGVRFWGGGSVIQMNSKGETFQVGLQEEKIIRQVKRDKFEE